MREAPYYPVACSACRKVVLVQQGVVNLPAPWRWNAGHSVLDTAPYCGDTCEAAGPPKPVRERIVAIVDFERGKKIAIAFRQGAADAMDGFDALSQDSQYREGHEAGMGLRKHVEKFAAAQRRVAGVYAKATARAMESFNEENKE